MRCSIGPARADARPRTSHRGGWRVPRTRSAVAGRDTAACPDWPRGDGAGHARRKPSPRGSFTRKSRHSSCGGCVSGTSTQRPPPKVQRIGGGLGDTANRRSNHGTTGPKSENQTKFTPLSPATPEHGLAEKPACFQKRTSRCECGDQPLPIFAASYNAHGIGVAKFQ